MKTIFILTAAVIILLGVVYAAFSFGHWDLNPGHWQIEARAICAGMCAFISIVVVVAYLEAFKIDKTKTDTLEN
jgi:hypothetical protein